MPPKFILKPGAEPFEFFDGDRTSSRLPIFFDKEIKKETVQSMRVTRKSSHLARHQQAAVCNQKVVSNARMQNQNAEREKLAETVRILLTEKRPSLRPQSALHNLF